MTATLNSFPSLNVFTSRSWVLASIILLHMAFFWVLSSGLAVSILEPLRKPIEVVPLPPIDQVTPAPLEIDEPELVNSQVTLPPVPHHVVLDQHDDVITARESIDRPVDRPLNPATHEPTISPPGIDPRIGLSEPTYPPQELRLGHAGTVLLSIQVLENGRVGDVRIEQSSGFRRLDDAAVRQASRWQLRPGTRDGVPVVMWKQIPITFRLRE